MAHPSQSPNARVSLTSSLRNLALLAGIGSIAIACSSSDNSGSSTPGVGGSSGTHTGGQGAGTGGSGPSATGGSSAQISSTTGGAGQGGTSQTASSTGGSNATGGTSATTTSAPATGGAATGGAATGGATAGGASGGAATGGKSSTGGASTTLGGSSAPGGAATGGTAAGGASSSPVTPQKVSDTDYRFTVGSVVLDINPQIGARVTSLKYSTTDIIKPYTCAAYNANDTCNNSGSTFWTSPQSAWDGVVGGSNVWPPVAATDGSPYTPAVNGTHLVLTGSADTTLGASVTKDISADAGTGWITMTYTITATKAIQAAGWQITRVARGGIVFFPFTTATNSTPPWTLSPTGTAPNQTEWIDDATQSSLLGTNGSKLIADGGNSGQAFTWLAYALGGNLLLLKYPNVAATAFAPSEGDTEVYPGGSTYMELEAQGPYGSLAANATSTWTVQWRVVPIPSSVTVAAGSATLLSFAQSQADM